MSLPTNAPSSGRRLRGALLWCLAALLFVALFAVSVRARLPHPTEQLEDSGQDYLLFGFNLARYQTFSLSREEPIKPRAYREPLYSGLLAVGILLDPALHSMPISEFFTSINTVHSRVRSLLSIQVALAIATALVAGGIVWRLTRGALPAAVTFFCVGLSPGILHYIHGYMPELLVTFLMTAAGALLMYTVQARRSAGYAATGAVVGLLTLTRAIFQYIFPVIGLFILVSRWPDPAKRRGVIRGTALYVICYFAIVGPWMARNYSLFDRPIVSERGGVVLNIRAAYDMMDRYEYLASFFYWTPGAEPLLIRLFAPEHYARFNENHRNSFYKDARYRRRVLDQRYGTDTPESDAALLREAMQHIVTHPIRHLAVTLPVAWRGILVEEFLTPLVSPLLFGCFFWLAIRAVRLRDLTLAAVLLPAVCSYAAYTLLTENRFRFNAPILPMAWISLVLVSHRAVSRSVRHDRGGGPPFTYDSTSA